MQKLFEHKIFRTDIPYRLRFTDEFGKSIVITSKSYEDSGFIPGMAEYVTRCVYNHLYHEVKDEDDDLVSGIADTILKLEEAKLIEHDQIVDEKCEHCDGTGMIDVEETA